MLSSKKLLSIKEKQTQIQDSEKYWRKDRNILFRKVPDNQNTKKQEPSISDRTFNRRVLSFLPGVSFFCKIFCLEGIYFFLFLPEPE